MPRLLLCERSCCCCVHSHACHSARHSSFGVQKQSRGNSTTTTTHTQHLHATAMGAMSLRCVFAVLPLRLHFAHCSCQFDVR